MFGLNEDFIESYQSLDVRFIKNKASTFFFEFDGDSMEPTILKGDILLVDRSIELFDRRVCIVCYEGHLVCKRVFMKSEAVVLCSDNVKYEDVVIQNSENIEIWGVVISRHGEVI